MSNPKLARILDLTAQIEARSALYEELDRLILELKDEGFQSELVDGLLYELKDNYAAANVQFRVAAVRRYEIKEVKPKRGAK